MAFNKFMKIIDGMGMALKALLAFIGSLTLAIGAIGLANIMLASVMERTREIGMLKAIGGRRRTILAQFLMEALVIVGAGALLGILFGVCLTWALGSMPLLGPLFKRTGAGERGPRPLTDLGRVSNDFHRRAIGHRPDSGHGASHQGLAPGPGRGAAVRVSGPRRPQPQQSVERVMPEWRAKAHQDGREQDAGNSAPDRAASEAERWRSGPRTAPPPTGSFAATSVDAQNWPVWLTGRRWAHRRAFR